MWRSCWRSTAATHAPSACCSRRCRRRQWATVSVGMTQAGGRSVVRGAATGGAARRRGVQTGRGRVVGGATCRARGPTGPTRPSSAALAATRRGARRQAAAVTLPTSPWTGATPKCTARDTPPFARRVEGQAAAVAVTAAVMRGGQRARGPRGAVGTVRAPAPPAVATRTTGCVGGAAQRTGTTLVQRRARMRQRRLRTGHRRASPSRRRVCVQLQRHRRPRARPRAWVRRPQASRP